jgi:hypothetical protein
MKELFISHVNLLKYFNLPTELMKDTLIENTQ